MSYHHCIPSRKKKQRWSWSTHFSMISRIRTLRLCSKLCWSSFSFWACKEAKRRAWKASRVATKIRDFIHQQSGWKKLTKQNGEIIDKYDIYIYIYHQASNMGFSVYINKWSSGSKTQYDSQRVMAAFHMRKSLGCVTENNNWEQ